MAGFWTGDTPDPLNPYIGAYGSRRLTGRGRGSPAGLPFQARGADPFQLTRERVQDELFSDPKLQHELDRNTTAEVGNDPAKRRWYQATVIDRAVQQGKPLAEVVNAPDYYPSSTTRATATTGQGVDESLWEGANPANYATGNASFDPKKGRWVGFAGGPQTSTYGTGIGAELGGIEGQAGLPYARAMGYQGPDRTAIGPGEGQPAETAVAGLYDQARYPVRNEGKKMPASLMDMFQPKDAAGDPTDFASALASQRNSLIGLGLGMLQPSNPLRGQSSYGNMLEGYQGGAALDQRQAAQMAQLKQQKLQNTRQAEMDRFNMGMREKEYVRSGEGEFERLMRAQGVAPGSPEFIEQAKKYALGKIEGDWEARDIIDPNDPDGERKMTVERNKRTGEFRLPTLPGQTGTAGAVSPNVFPSASGQGGGTAPVYGQGPGGYSATPQAAPGAAPAERHAITLPSGEVVRPPPGLNKEARKAWASDVAKTVADMQTGKMTESQATKAIHATGMEIAQRELKTLEGEGTSQWGKAMSRVPWGLGTYAQSAEYQNYRNAKDAWLNAKLRAESGATINPDEFARDDRIFFPQPGENEEQVKAKAVLREHITRNMIRAGGPGYTSPPPGATPTAKTKTPQPTGGAAPLPPGVKPPPPGFNVIAP